MAWLRRTLVGIVVAAIAGGGVALDRRRAAHRKRAKPKRATAIAPTAPASAPGEADDQESKPLLSPTRFTLSHFSMLVVLLAMMIGGLMLRGVRRYPPQTTWYVHGGDVQRGRAAVIAHGCGGCHVIPRISDATGRVGPGLDGFAERMYIGGQLPNTPDNLIAWLQNPQRYAPGTAMPNLPISEPVARDMAAFLYSHR